MNEGLESSVYELSLFWQTVWTSLAPRNVFLLIVTSKEKMVEFSNINSTKKGLSKVFGWGTPHLIES